MTYFNDLVYIMTIKEGSFVLCPPLFKSTKNMSSSLKTAPYHIIVDINFMYAYSTTK